MHLSALADRQLGLEPSFFYDTVLHRLIARRCDSFSGISPNEARLDYNPCPPLFACRFAERPGFEHFLGLANEDGRVAIQDTRVSIKHAQEPTTFTGYQCHSNAIFDLVWKPGEMSFVTVSGDHSAKLWNITGPSMTNVLDFYGHTKSVRTAAFRPSDPSVFATGARDGKILVWDTRAGGSVGAITRPSNAIHNCHPIPLVKTPGSASKKNLSKVADRQNSITGLVFQDDNSLISCGAGDGSIRVWDLRRNYSNFKKDPLPKHSIPYCGSSSKNGYSNLILDSSRIKLYANCVDDVIYCFNVSTYNTQPEQKYIGHENGSFYIKSSLSSDSKYLVSGSSNSNAYIWNLKYSEPILELTGHHAEVTCGTWCQKGDIKIVTCSDNNSHKIWRIGNELQYSELEDEISGRAHIIEPVDKSKKAHWETLDRTPKPAKRKIDGDGDATSLKRASLNPYDSPEDNIPPPIIYTRRSKRSLIDMMNDSLVLPKFQDDFGESAPKKRALDSDKNIISNIDYGPSTSYINNSPSTLASIPENSVLVNSEESFSVKRTFTEEDFKTPTKKINATLTSPHLYYYSPNRILNSPTMNLPNFVTDGKAPHLRSDVPHKKSGNVDWLTKIRQVKTNEANLGCKMLSKHDNNEGHNNPEKPKQEKTLLQFFNRTPQTEEECKTPLLDKTNKIHPSLKRKSTDTSEFETIYKSAHRSKETDSAACVSSPKISKTSNNSPIPSASKTPKNTTCRSIRSFFVVNNTENKK